MLPSQFYIFLFDMRPQCSLKRENVELGREHDNCVEKVFIYSKSAACGTFRLTVSFSRDAVQDHLESAGCCQVGDVGVSSETISVLLIQPVVGVVHRHVSRIHLSVLVSKRNEKGKKRKIQTNFDSK